MPYADNEGIRIHYAVEGKGPALVLLHGFTTSSKYWRDQGYVEALKDDHTLVLINARGHGASDKPHTSEAYSGALSAGDVVVVLDALGIEKAHYWGYSMDGQIGFHLAKHALSRFHSLVLGGASPYRREGGVRTRNVLLKR